MKRALLGMLGAGLLSAMSHAADLQCTEADKSTWLPAAKVKALKPSGMTVATQGKLNKLVCAYPEDINLTYRTKGACAVDNAKACASDPATCKASCE